ncbi:MAG: membrane protein [Acidimicrobiia bacterium]|nr:MAG: membrane protein [Acidimicrobiia bacterium]
MTCEQARASLSAVLDGEAAPGASVRLEAHLRTCAACRAYERDLAALHRLVRVTAAPTVPDLTAAILARTGGAPRPDRASGALRLALVAVALVQVLVAVPTLLATGDAAHAQHLAAFDVALAVGFAWVAARPAPSLNGFLPVGTVLVAACVSLTVLEAANGNSESLASHGVAVAGIVLAWALEARVHGRLPGARAAVA